MRMAMLALLLLWSQLAQAGFVRRLPCTRTDAAPTAPIFDLNSLGGALDVSNDSTTLSFEIDGDYLGPNDCEALNGAVAQPVVNVSVLGRPVGVQMESSGYCPTVSPDEGLR